MDTTIIIFLTIIGLVVAYVSWLFEQEKREKREKYRNWAEFIGWSYDHREDREIYHRYLNFDRLQRGSNRYAFDVLQGMWDEYPARAFSFHYSTSSSSGSSQYGIHTIHHNHYVGVVLIQIEPFFPKLLIYPTTLFGKIRSALGFGGIKFESVEFSKRFTVRCHDQKFAYDFCHPKMIEYLLTRMEDFLTRTDTVIELEGNVLALFKEKELEIDEIEEGLVRLIHLRELM